MAQVVLAPPTKLISRLREDEQFRKVLRGDRRKGRVSRLALSVAKRLLSRLLGALGYVSPSAAPVEKLVLGTF